MLFSSLMSATYAPSTDASVQLAKLEKAVPGLSTLKGVFDCSTTCLMKRQTATSNRPARLGRHWSWCPSSRAGRPFVFHNSGSFRVVEVEAGVVARSCGGMSKTPFSQSCRWRHGTFFMSDKEVLLWKRTAQALLKRYCCPRTW